MECEILKKHNLTDFEYRRLLNLIVTTGGLESEYLNNITFPFTVKSEPKLNTTYQINNIDTIINSGRLNDAIARLAAKMVSSTEKEYIVCDMFGFYKDNSLYGYDGCFNDRGIEVKTEAGAGSKSKKLEGKATFSKVTLERLNKWRNDNPIVYQCGYVQEKLYYVLEFEYKYIADFLENQYTEKLKTSKNGINGTYTAKNLLELNVPINIKYMVQNILEFKQYSNTSLLKLFEKSSLQIL